ncbi:TetR/AcrR family transcriptional regulator [Streptomyces albus]|uniref:TetR/AcrR family transcriptional regulator n=2 Tax=Streptomyces TaxID=1883 RepID=A0A6C1CBD3_9ACTN|nr:MULTISPECIES: TetR/AcrR family transcriptional regulator [Streptomyces]QID40183.1 TetR/AcrR family transcriptional regulator [Streptomyces albus]TGG81341.1 TetR/AcrR family transcriptional regulator [Streptomyces albus]UVN56021.1 TetR/AcrR family transcriptional regulator [Streptomyces albus]
MHGSHAATATTAAVTALADSRPTTTNSAAGPARATATAPAAAPRTAPLRVDAQRNLEHVLRAAREVFGELGYGAPMEDVARRARVGVGTVYRRFPSKDVLVRRIAEEETARLTEQARAALGQEEEPWSALSRFLRTSVASGAGRLLPPRILRAEGWTDGTPRVPQQRAPAHTEYADAEYANASGTGAPTGAGAPPDLRIVERTPADSAAGVGYDGLDEDPGAVELLQVVGQLVERARAAGELRPDVTVSDVLLVIATAAPSLPDAAQQAAASTRLLDILLEGLRSRTAH